MRGVSYRYNAATCRYERATISIGGTISYVLGITLTATCLLMAMLMIHDSLVDSEKETAFIRENRALQNSQVILTNQIEDIQRSLAVLRQKDETLHYKFFRTRPAKESSAASSDAKSEILLADAATLQRHVDDLLARSNALLIESRETSEGLASHVSISRDDFSMFPTLPLLKPVRDFEPRAILSGFGIRINPYHKGLYKHLGIDIAVPRGTDVMVTAPGKVLTVKYSNLQAGFGNYVEVDHGGGYVTRYAHLEEIFVRPGETVSAGHRIAFSGNSGGSVAPHLHYEILKDGTALDPVAYLLSGVDPHEHEAFRYFGTIQNQSLD